MYKRERGFVPALPVTLNFCGRGRSDIDGKKDASSGLSTSSLFQNTYLVNLGLSNAKETQAS